MPSDDPTRPQRVDGLTGTVVRGPFAMRSKSARIAIWLETTDDRRFVLRRKDGPAFGDRALNRFVGKRVKCAGFITSYTLLAERIEILK